MTTYDRLEITTGGDVLVNGEPPASDLLRDEAEGQFLDYRKVPSTCEYCGAPVQERFWYREVDEDWEIWDGDKTAILISCDHCRFWEWYRHDRIPSSMGHPDENHLQCASKLRTFDGDLPGSIDGELAQYLRRRPDAWCQFTPIVLERVVADILRANCREAEVIHVGRPDDGGVDVLLGKVAKVLGTSYRRQSRVPGRFSMREKREELLLSYLIDAGGPTWLVQVKRRQRLGSVESIETLRNLLGAVVLHGALHGLIVSTADRFSTRARAAVPTARQFGYEIRLADRGCWGVCWIRYFQSSLGWMS